MKETNFELAKEIIDQAIFDLLPPEDPENDESKEAVNNLIDEVVEGYILVQWPESQDLMEEEWFDKEAILALDSEDKTGRSAYFVPIKRIV